MSSEPSSSSSVPRWLKSLPLAPEYRPSDTDFDDPIAFISRIEREASLFGICKIIPPSPSSSSSSNSSSSSSSNSSSLSLSNLSRSLAPSFTTRHQELGLHRKNPSPKQQVWQSGHSYTLDSFHSKSKLFSRAQLHPHHPNHPHPLLLETLFWNAAASDKPIWVEYANDVPGSGFSPHRKNNRYNPNPNPNPSGRRRRRSGSLDPGGAAAAATLSDSKWNLQVIARAPGSLTRFMPDDIPGVTSPMVYVAMLFSWFAWHVEDHELHSLNFLHVGAPKTWYAVPGDRAGEFEEVVRVKGYGGNVGRLEAFAMLGEKTTLLSPEVVVASGIPCCRLVQNPGEFVVTFPRAYHIGFSHGFNCGEAANFATPQWLKVAKEAAVRRAAMNYLPMLSHQQLLYILTLSFVSRVPRALFSGVRSSRLKDRKREEREILVKKAFLNDMMAENNLLCVLLSKESTSNAVLWEPDLLLSPPTVSQSRSSLSLEAQMSGNNVVDHGRDNQDDCAMENLTVSARDVPCQIVASIEAQKNACYSSPTFDEELVEDLDADEDDLPVGLKIDSGTLPCVACGILGYPFMAVVQPSELAHKEVFHVNCEQSHQILGNSNCLSLPSFLPSSGCKFKSEENGSKFREQANPDSCQELSTECVGHVRVTEGRGSRDELPNSDVQLPNLLDVKTSKSEHGFCRPRIFCLQHALEIEELLQCKGGANVLIICHSDYIKIKAYTTSVAEEVGMQFNFKDIPLENASPCDLDLINISISDEGHDEHDEDWTSKLGMNLRYSVKPRNQSVSKQEKLSVILCRMFSDNFPPAFSTLKWQSKRSRTPYKVVGVSLSKSYIDVNIEKSESVVRNTNTDSTAKLQVYQSRKRKANAMVIKYFGHLGEGIPESIDCRNDSDCRENYLNKQEDDKNSYELFSVPISAAEDLQMYQDTCEPLGVSTLDKIVDPCRSETCSPNVNVPVLERSEMQNFSAEECGTWSNVSTSGKSELQAKIVEPEYKNIEVQQETGVVVEINSGYEFESTSCSESEMIQHTSASGERNLEGSLCNLLLPVNQPCDNSEVHPEVFAAGKPDSSFDHSSKVEERFSVEEFGTKSKFDTATSEKSESQGNLSKPEAKVPEVQLGARATDASSSQREGHNSSDSSCVSKKIQNITISQEPDLVGILENSLLSVDQPSAPILSYDNNLEIQLEVANAETHNKGVNVEQSSKLEGQTVSNWSTVDKCELQKVEPPTPEENGGYGNSQLNSRSGTTSSQRQLENLPTDEIADVTHGIPVVDNSSMNSAHIVPISVLDKTEKKTADGLKCHRNMNYVDVITYVRRRYKRKLEEEQVAVAHHSCSSFIRGPCEGLRPRSERIAAPESADRKTMEKKATPAIPKRLGKDRDKKSYACDIEGCRMGFRTREELQLHLESLCTHKGCRKQFKSHKHLIQHQRVHLDERPLKCPWKRCEKSFKWAWARTEHIRLHTGERPYKCRVAGCGETFRFVSDFSRHRRKTGHSVNSK